MAADHLKLYILILYLVIIDTTTKAACMED